ncbi:unnamed protein product [Ilex paraguariensis]|uniref:Plastid division protein PDV2 n=1 Tax=Ilex paraguariensis TaxID=185542 RepID=A0ABC8SV80_9AQUA
MDEDRIGLVLARASELRSKITNCIYKASSLPTDHIATEEREGDDREAEAEAESLLNIRDALESLEAQLSSLQALQQQQCYEKEAALAEIDYIRKKLLKKLKEYKGQEIEVIHEATAFASETVEDNNDLLLPPYPTRPSCSLMSDNDHLSHFPSTHKFAQNGVTRGEAKNELKKSIHDSERNEVQSETNGSFKGVRIFFSMVAKSVLTVVGVISVLSLAGYEPTLRRRGSQFKILGLSRGQGAVDKEVMVQCPAGKVPVVENGKTRCLVKERVEIPFDPVVAMPDVNYGCG